MALRRLFLVTAMPLLIPSGMWGTTIDFETIPGGTPIEGLHISNQFQATHGVTFSLLGGGSPVLAKVGAPQTAFQGYELNPDQPAPGTNAGSFFLTDDGVVAGPPAPLLVDYTAPVSAASGILLDIDGTEQWTLTAFDASMISLATLVLPPNNVIDGSATFWSFNLGSPVITRIEFQYTGIVTTAVGLAFDNFSPSSVPEPGIGILLAAGFGACARRRLRGCR